MGSLISKNKQHAEDVKKAEKDILMIPPNVLMSMGIFDFTDMSKLKKPHPHQEKQEPLPSLANAAHFRII